MLGAVAANWEIVAIGGGVPLLVFSLFLIPGTRSNRLRVVWAGSAVLFGVVSSFGLYYAFGRPIPRASAASRPTALQTLPAQTGSPTPGGASCSPNGTSLRIGAKNVQFTASCLAVPAKQAFTIAFDNQDSGVAHNLHIFSPVGSDRFATSVFAGDLVTGPNTATYRVPALSAGTYAFRCDVHPTTMTGTLVVP